MIDIQKLADLAEIQIVDKKSCLLTLVFGRIAKLSKSNH